MPFVLTNSKQISVYDKKISQSHTAYQLTSPLGRVTRHQEYTWLLGAIGNIYDCRSRGCKLDSDLVSYFRGD